MTDAAGVVTFPRQEFIQERFRHAAGEHVTVLGPTGWGKTRLLNELAEEVSHPELPAIFLAAKPRDKTMTAWTKRVGARQVKTWPPRRKWLGEKSPSAYTLWPEHTFDPDVDDENLYQNFRNAILESYRTGNRIIVADELLELTHLGLTREMVALWTRGRSMEVSLFGASQKPTDIPTYAYGQAAHIFLGNDPDERSRKRFSEIGGVDPRLVRDLVSGLEKFQWLYIRRDGPKMCIVDR